VGDQVGWKLAIPLRNGYFYLYDEDEQRVLEDSDLVFSVKPTKVFAVNVGRSQTRHQF
jgi:hypothetical protein